MLTITQQHNARLDAYCVEVGRDPGAIRRSVLIFTQAEYQRLYSIPEAFDEIVRRYQEIDISEIVYFYPFVPVLMPMFERIVHEAIPRLRSENPIAEALRNP